MAALVSIAIAAALSHASLFQDRFVSLAYSYAWIIALQVGMIAAFLLAWAAGALDSDVADTPLARLTLRSILSATVKGCVVLGAVALFVKTFDLQAVRSQSYREWANSNDLVPLSPSLAWVLAAALVASWSVVILRVLVVAIR